MTKEEIDLGDRKKSGKYIEFAAIAMKDNRVIDWKVVEIKRIMLPVMLYNTITC